MEPSMTPRIEQQMRQTMILSPKMIQSIELLQLPAFELLETIKQELEQNPVLEIRDDAETPEPEAEKEESRSDQVEPEPPPERTEDEAAYPREGFAELEIYEDDWQEQYTQRRVARSGETDGKMDFLQNTAARPMSLQDVVFEQFSLVDKPEGVAEAGKQIIYNLDANGYLRYLIEEIAESAGGSITLDDAREALKIIQSLDPKGLGARDTKECLLLQLDPDDPSFALKKELIEKHLNDIAENKLPKVAHEMGLDMEELKNLISEIATLNPRPGTTLTDERVPYIVPDVVVNMVDGEYVVQIESSNLPRLRINSFYAETIKGGNAPTSFKQFIHQKMDFAKWLIRAIEQRRRTVFRIASEVVRLQKEFLDEGIHRLKPLGLKEVAENLSISVSTVSRAIDHKYIQTPRGIFAMKYFFSTEVGSTPVVRSATSPDPNVVGTVVMEPQSQRSVKAKIADIVDSEDKKNPLSDDDIAAKLKDVGLTVARRTITKYREQAGIQSSRMRRRY